MTQDARRPSATNGPSQRRTSTLASEWAAKRQAKIEAAQAKKLARENGEMTDQHTFHPQTGRARASARKATRMDSNGSARRLSEDLSSPIPAMEVRMSELPHRSQRSSDSDDLSNLATAKPTSFRAPVGTSTAQSSQDNSLFTQKEARSCIHERVFDAGRERSRRQREYEHLGNRSMGDALVCEKNGDDPWLYSQGASSDATTTATAGFHVMLASSGTLSLASSYSMEGSSDSQALLMGMSSQQSPVIDTPGSVDTRGTLSSMSPECLLRQCSSVLLASNSQKLWMNDSPDEEGSEQTRSPSQARLFRQLSSESLNGESLLVTSNAPGSSTTTPRSVNPEEKTLAAAVAAAVSAFGTESARHENIRRELRELRNPTLRRSECLESESSFECVVATKESLMHDSTGSETTNPIERRLESVGSDKSALSRSPGFYWDGIATEVDHQVHSLSGDGQSGSSKSPFRASFPDTGFKEEALQLSENLHLGSQIRRCYLKHQELVINGLDVGQRLATSQGFILLQSLKAVLVGTLHDSFLKWFANCHLAPGEQDVSLFDFGNALKEFYLQDDMAKTEEVDQRFCGIEAASLSAPLGSWRTEREECDTCISEQNSTFLFGAVGETATPSYSVASSAATLSREAVTGNDTLGERSWNVSPNNVCRSIPVIIPPDYPSCHGGSSTSTGHEQTVGPAELSGEVCEGVPWLPFREAPLRREEAVPGCPTLQVPRRSQLVSPQVLHRDLESMPSLCCATAPVAIAENSDSHAQESAEEAKRRWRRERVESLERKCQELEQDLGFAKRAQLVLQHELLTTHSRSNEKASFLDGHQEDQAEVDHLRQELREELEVAHERRRQPGMNCREAVVFESAVEEDSLDNSVLRYDQILPPQVFSLSDLTSYHSRVAPTTSANWIDAAATGDTDDNPLDQSLDSTFDRSSKRLLLSPVAEDPYREETAASSDDESSDALIYSGRRAIRKHEDKEMSAEKRQLAEVWEHIQVLRQHIPEDKDNSVDEIKGLHCLLTRISSLMEQRLPSDEQTRCCHEHLSRDANDSPELAGSAMASGCSTPRSLSPLPTLSPTSETIRAAVPKLFGAPFNNCQPQPLRREIEQDRRPSPRNAPITSPRSPRDVRLPSPREISPRDLRSQSRNALPYSPRDVPLPSPRDLPPESPRDVRQPPRRVPASSPKDVPSLRPSLVPQLR